MSVQSLGLLILKCLGGSRISGWVGEVNIVKGRQKETRKLFQGRISEKSRFHAKNSFNLNFIWGEVGGGLCLVHLLASLDEFVADTHTQDVICFHFLV